MPWTSSPRRRALLAGAGLTLTCTLLAVTLPANASLDGGNPAAVTGTVHGWQTDPVYSINLPYEDPPQVPAGPNRQYFTAQCRLCHSTRLVFTQPRLSEKQWAAVVHKMVTVYGAPIPPDDEKLLVAYLMAVRGKAP